MREEGVGAGFGESAHVVVLLLVALKRGREELIDLHRAVSCAPDHLDTQNRPVGKVDYDDDSE